MINKLYKGFEEAAREYAINDDSIIDSCDTTSVSDSYVAGAEHGYKEDIAEVKEYFEKKLDENHIKFIEATENEEKQ